MNREEASYNLKFADSLIEEVRLNTPMLKVEDFHALKVIQAELRRIREEL